MEICSSAEKITLSLWMFLSNITSVNERSYHVSRLGLCSNVRIALVAKWEQPMFTSYCCPALGEGKGFTGMTEITWFSTFLRWGKWSAHLKTPLINFHNHRVYPIRFWVKKLKSCFNRLVQVEVGPRVSNTILLSFSYLLKEAKYGPRVDFL